MTKSKLLNLSIRKALLIAGLLYLGIALYMFILAPRASAAACVAPTTDYGTVTTTLSVPQTGNYRVWSRMATTNATDNSYMLEIDGTSCFTVGDGAFSATTWAANSSNWVDYQAGTTTNKINMNLSAGSHTVKLIGNAPNVKVDRVVLTSDTSCVPVGVGDNCASPADVWAPTLSAITSPANNSSYDSGSVITISANATDDVGGSGIQRVDFHIDGVVAGSDTTSPYSFAASGLSVGQHTLIARAYDRNGNNTASSPVTINVIVPPDTTNPTVTITTPANNAIVLGTVPIAATASDNIGISRVEFYVDNQLVGTDNTTSSFTHSLDTLSLANGAHTIRATAYDTASPNNNSASSTVINITVNNPTTPPLDTTKPTVSISSPATNTTQSGTFTVTAAASDNVGVAKVEFMVDGQIVNTDTAAPFTFSLNTTSPALANGVHTLSAKAYDTAAIPNVQTSTVVNINVNNVTYISEDINQDGKVNLLDFSELSSKYGLTGSAAGRADIDRNGTVNLLDFSRLANMYGYGS